MVVALGLAVYLPSVNAPFYMDDMPNIVDNPRIMSLSSIPSMFSDIEGRLASRPLTLASFALNYAVGGLDTTLYHVVNIALHLTNGVLLYLLVVATALSLGVSDTRARRAALLSSLVFVLHPVQTEAVSYVVSRSMLLCVLFYLAGMLLFLKASLEHKGGKPRYRHMFGLFAVSFLGMASREDFATFPLMVLLYDYAFISKGDIKGLLSRWRLHLSCLIPLAYLAYLVSSYEYIGAGLKVESVTPATYLLTQFNVFFAYLRLLALPINLNLDYDYTVSRAIFQFPTALSLVGYVLLWGVAVWRIRKTPALSFSALWFLVALLPSSSVVPLVDLIFEHRLYLPSIGAFALLSMAAVSMAERQKWARRAIVPACIALVLLSALTASRNALWADERGFWEDTAGKSPLKARPRHNLAVVYERMEMFDAAEAQYKAAIALDPFYTQARVNLGILQMNRGRDKEAIEAFTSASNMDSHLAGEGMPEFSPHAHYNLGVIYHRKGRLEDAMREFKAVIRKDPFSSEAHNNLGVVYMDMGRLDEAALEFEETIRLAPRFAEARFNLGVAYGKRGDHAGAGQAYTAAIEVDPTYAEAHNNLGAVYIETGLYDEAVREFQAAAGLEPENTVYRENLARAVRIRQEKAGSPVEAR